MRTALLAAIALTGLSTASVEAATYTYVFDGSFASSWSVSNLNGRAPVPGGTLVGSVTFETNLSSFSILDYHLETVQPGVYASPLHTAVFDFDDQGIGTAYGPAAVGKGSIGVAANSLSLFDYVPGPFSGYTWATSFDSLAFSFVDDLLGASSLQFTVTDLYGNCQAYFDIFGAHNPCAGFAGGQDGSFTATLLTQGPSPVPLPAGLVLLLTGVAGFGVMRRRA